MVIANSTVITGKALDQSLSKDNWIERRAVYERPNIVKLRCEADTYEQGFIKSVKATFHSNAIVAVPSFEECDKGPLF